MTRNDEGIGRRIAFYRKLEGWSAQKLADESGVSRSVIANIENGRKADLAVSELVALSSALRVPAGVLIYEAGKPLHPTGEGSEDEEGEERHAFAARNIDAIDWLNGVDTETQSDEELEEFSKLLAEVDRIIIYPLGLQVSAQFGKAGRFALAQINAGRQLVIASSRRARIERHMSTVLVAGLSREDHHSLLEPFMDASRSGSFYASQTYDRIIEKLDDSLANAFARLAQRADAAVRDFKQAKNQVRSLDGDPTPSLEAMSLRQAMGMVRTFPHETVKEFEARGGQADGEVSNPLTVSRADELSLILRSLQLED